jgi:hypothetical protein
MAKKFKTVRRIYTDKKTGKKFYTTHRAKVDYNLKEGEHEDRLGQKYTEEEFNPSGGKQFARGVAPAAVGTGIAALAGGGAGGVGQGVGATMNAAANVAANRLEAYHPDSKAAAMTASGMSTGASAASKAFNKAMNRTGSGVAALKSGALAGAQGVLQGAISSVPGGKTFGGALGKTAAGFMSGGVTGALKGFAQGVLTSPTLGADMKNFLKKSSASDYNEGTWGQNMTNIEDENKQDEDAAKEKLEAENKRREDMGLPPKPDPNAAKGATGEGTPAPATGGEAAPAAEGEAAPATGGEAAPAAAPKDADAEKEETAKNEATAKTTAAKADAENEETDANKKADEEMEDRTNKAKSDEAEGQEKAKASDAAGKDEESRNVGAGIGGMAGGVGGYPLHTPQTGLSADAYKSIVPAQNATKSADEIVADAKPAAWTEPAAPPSVAAAPPPAAAAPPPSATAAAPAAMPVAPPLKEPAPPPEPRAAPPVAEGEAEQGEGTAPIDNYNEMSTEELERNLERLTREHEELARQQPTAQEEIDEFARRHHFSDREQAALSMPRDFYFQGENQGKYQNAISDEKLREKPGYNEGEQINLLKPKADAVFEDDMGTEFIKTPLGLIRKSTSRDPENYKNALISIERNLNTNNIAEAKKHYEMLPIEDRGIRFSDSHYTSQTHKMLKEMHDDLESQGILSPERSNEILNKAQNLYSTLNPKLRGNEISGESANTLMKKIEGVHKYYEDKRADAQGQVGKRIRGIGHLFSSYLAGEDTPVEQSPEQLEEAFKRKEIVHKPYGNNKYIFNPAG